MLAIISESPCSVQKKQTTNNPQNHCSTIHYSMMVFTICPGAVEESLFRNQIRNLGFRQVMSREDFETISKFVQLSESFFVNHRNDCLD